MRRLLTLAAIPIALLAQGCDTMRMGVQNASGGKISVEYIFKPGAECGGTPQPIDLDPGKMTATTCPSEDVDKIRVVQGDVSCEIIGQKLVRYAATGKPYPIVGCPDSMK